MLGQMKTQTSMKTRIQLPLNLTCGFGFIALTLLTAGPAFGQGGQITAVSPNSAFPGTSGLTVTFTLPNSTPPTPPAGILPDSVTIGSISGTSLTHSTLDTVTAVFDIPAGESRRR